MNGKHRSSCTYILKPREIITSLGTTQHPWNIPQVRQAVGHGSVPTVFHLPDSCWPARWGDTTSSVVCLDPILPCALATGAANLQAITHQLDLPGCNISAGTFCSPALSDTRGQLSPASLFGITPVPHHHWMSCRFFCDPSRCSHSLVTFHLGAIAVSFATLPAVLTR